MSAGDRPAGRGAGRAISFRRDLSEVLREVGGQCARQPHDLAIVRDRDPVPPS
jgi:hypothetical protein